MQRVTQFQFRAEALKWSSQLRKNNFPFHAVHQALCSERFFLQIFYDNTPRNTVCKLSMRFSTPKHFQHAVGQWIMYLSTWNRFFGVKFVLRIQKMWKIIALPAHFWEVNLLNRACSRQILVVYLSIKSCSLCGQREGKGEKEWVTGRDYFFCC